MSVQDLERGPEAPQLGTGLLQPQTSIQYPMRPPIGREATMSPSQMTHGGSYYHSGTLQLDSPILAAFRYHIGIHNDPSLHAAIPPNQVQGRDGLTSRSVGDMVSTLANTLSTSNTVVAAGAPIRPASNLGIYQRVIAAETKYHREYQIFAILINGALGLQIIFAAALTALGAGNGPHDAVTAFGALNTVLAGLLTFLKGSGLPNRLKYYENEWSKVREYIEQRERDFASDAQLGRLGWEDFAGEIANIESMYEGVRKDIEANTPDSYISMSNAIRNLHANNNNNNNNNTSPSLARGLSRLNQKMNTAEEDVREASRGMNGRVTSGISEIDYRGSKAWGDLEKRSMVNIREVADECNDQVRGVSENIGKQADYHFTTTQQVAGDGLRGAQGSAEAKLNNAHLAAQSRVNQSQQQFQEGQHHTESKAKEMEDKIAMVAEKAAEKVLEFTRHRHH